MNTDEELRRRVAELFDRITLAIDKASSDGPLDVAIDRLCGRVLLSYQTILLLTVQCQHQWDIDAATILRAMYDAFLQTAYIVCDEENAENLANDYLNFEHVIKYKQSQIVFGQQNSTARYISNSPDRLQGDSRNQEHFGKHRPGFKKQSGRDWSTWYKGALSDIAGRVDRVSGSKFHEEYFWLIGLLNGAVHSESMTMRNGSVIAQEHAEFYSTLITARCLRISVAVSGAWLDKVDANELIELCVDDLLDSHPGDDG